MHFTVTNFSNYLNGVKASIDYHIQQDSWLEYDQRRDQKVSITKQQFAEIENITKNQVGRICQHLSNLYDYLESLNSYLESNSLSEGEAVLLFQTLGNHLVKLNELSKKSLTYQVWHDNADTWSWDTSGYNIECTISMPVGEGREAFDYNIFSEELLRKLVVFGDRNPTFFKKLCKATFSIDDSQLTKVQYQGLSRLKKLASFKVALLNLAHEQVKKIDNPENMKSTVAYKIAAENQSYWSNYFSLHSQSQNTFDKVIRSESIKRTSNGSFAAAKPATSFVAHGI